jgi:hypothetical protein
MDLPLPQCPWDWAARYRTIVAWSRCHWLVTCITFSNLLGLTHAQYSTLEEYYNTPFTGVGDNCLILCTYPSYVLWMLFSFPAGHLFIMFIFMDYKGILAWIFFMLMYHELRSRAYISLVARVFLCDWIHYIAIYIM